MKPDDLADLTDLDLFADETEDVEHDGYLAIGVGPRDCRNVAGLRPCPFVGCPSHLLLDYIHGQAHAAPSLTLNRARLPMFLPADHVPERGRRRELPPTTQLGSADDLGFQRRAVERLWELPETCAREVAERTGGLEIRALSKMLGAEEDEVGMDLDDVLCAMRGAAILAGASGDDDAGEMLERALTKRKPTPCK